MDKVSALGSSLVSDAAAPAKISGVLCLPDLLSTTLSVRGLAKAASEPIVGHWLRLV